MRENRHNYLQSLAFVIAIWILCAALAWGQRPSVSNEKNPDILEVSPFGGGSFLGKAAQGTEDFANGGTAGVRSTFNFSRYLSLETSYGFMVNNVRTGTGAFGNQIHSIALNQVYNFTPRGSTVRPYVTAGIGGLWFRPTAQARTRFGVNGSTELAVNYGGGVKVHLSPHLGLRFDARGILARNPTFGLASIPQSHIMGWQATAGLVFYFWQQHSAQAAGPEPVAAEPKAVTTLQPLNLGEITGGTASPCQGRVLTLHATTTDPAGHSLSYAWKVNGLVVGTNNPDLAFTPNNAGDFQFEVEVSDSTDPARLVRLGPKTFPVQDYVLPRIESMTASPNVIEIVPESPSTQKVQLAGAVALTPCGGNLSYKWAVSEGSLSNDAGPNAVFDTSSLSFEPGLGQTKTVTATLTATDETGKTASRNTTITVNYPAQFKRLADVIFGKNSSRVNNCGKRILIEQAAPQAGAAFDVLLVGHAGHDEMESGGRALDQRRLLAAAAVLTGNHGTCANLDVSQVLISAAGAIQLSRPEPGLCGTSNLPPASERLGAEVTEADRERRVEVYLIPKGSQVLPASARNAMPVPAGAVRVLGCPK